MPEVPPPLDRPLARRSVTNTFFPWESKRLEETSSEMVCFPNFGMFVIVTGTWECLAERNDEQFKAAHYSVDLRGVPPWKLLYFPSSGFNYCFYLFQLLSLLRIVSEHSI